MTMLGFAANVPGIVPGVGFWSRAGLTNKCTNYNASPNGALASMTLAGDAAATLTEVDDTAQLQIAGLFGADKPCANGKVFKLDSSAGVGNAWAVIEGGAGNTNAHTYSAYARTAGAGNGWLFLEDFTGTIATFAGGSYARRSGTTAINNALRKMIVGADAGTAVFFILNQFVEGSLPRADRLVGYSLERGRALRRESDRRREESCRGKTAGGAKSFRWNDNRSGSEGRDHGSCCDIKVTRPDRLIRRRTAMKLPTLTLVTAPFATPRKHVLRLRLFGNNGGDKRACAETPLTVLSSVSIQLDRRRKGKVLCGSSP